jgi:hypothetical protein
MYLKNLQIFSPKVFPAWINEIIPIPKITDPNYPTELIEEYKKYMGVEFYIKFQSDTFFGAQMQTMPLDLSATPKEAVAQIRLINRPLAFKKNENKKAGEIDKTKYHRGGINFQFDHYYYTVSHDGLYSGESSEYSIVTDARIVKNSTIDVDFQLYDFWDNNSTADKVLCLCPKFLVSALCFPMEAISDGVFCSKTSLSEIPSPKPEDCYFEYWTTPVNP